MALGNHLRKGHTTCGKFLTYFDLLTNFVKLILNIYLVGELGRKWTNFDGQLLVSILKVHNLVDFAEGSFIKESADHIFVVQNLALEVIFQDLNSASGLNFHSTLCMRIKFNI